MYACQSAVPGQVTGGPTAATRGSQPPTQPVVEAARLGQLSTVRMLLDSGTATVEDRDEVSVCVRIYLYNATSKQQYMAVTVYYF